MTRQKYLFVINPKSGVRNNTDYESIIKRYADNFHFQYKIYYTTGENDPEKIKEHIDDFEPEVVVAVGGDGTINDVAGILIGTTIHLGIIPNGSANGLAFNLNIPTQFEAALIKNLEGSFKPIDVILINDKHYCLHLSDLGLNARIVKRFEKEGSKGLFGYGKQLLKELFSPKSYFSFTIQTDDSEKKSKAEMVVIANAHSYGTGVKINPLGTPDDGKFEVVVIKPYPWWFIITFIYRGFAGNAHKLQNIEVFKTERAEINLKHSQDFQVDGEVLEKTKKVKMEILKHSLIVVNA